MLVACRGGALLLAPATHRSRERFPIAGVKDALDTSIAVLPRDCRGREVSHLELGTFIADPDEPLETF